MATNGQGGKTAGRGVVVAIGDSAPSEVFTTLGAVLNSKSISFSTEQLDVTNDGGEEWRQGIPGGKRAGSLSIGGNLDLNNASFEILRGYEESGALFNIQWQEPVTGSDGAATTNPRIYQMCVQITAFDDEAATDGTYDYTATLESAGTRTIV